MKINKFLKLCIISGLMVALQVNSMFYGTGGCIKNLLFGDCISNSKKFKIQKEDDPSLTRSEFTKSYVKKHHNTKAFTDDEDIKKVKEYIEQLKKQKEAFHCARSKEEMDEKLLVRKELPLIIEKLHNTENIKDFDRYKTIDKNGYQDAFLFDYMQNANAKTNVNSLWYKFFGNKKDSKSKYTWQDGSYTILLNDEADIKKLNQYHDTYFNALIANQNAYLTALEKKSKRRLYNVCKNFVGTDFIKQEEEEKRKKEQHEQEKQRIQWDEDIKENKIKYIIDHPDDKDPFGETFSRNNEKKINAIKKQRAQNERKQQETISLNMLKAKKQASDDQEATHNKNFKVGFWNRILHFFG